jgi:hypothetical protein
MKYMLPPQGHAATQLTACTKLGADDSDLDQDGDNDK